MKKVFQICFVLALFSNLATSFGQKSGEHYNRRQPETGASGSSERMGIGEVVITGTPYSNQTNTSALQPSSSPTNSGNGIGRGNNTHPKPAPKPTPKKVTTQSGCGVGATKVGPFPLIVGGCGKQTTVEYTQE